MYYYSVCFEASCISEIYYALDVLCVCENLRIFLCVRSKKLEELEYVLNLCKASSCACLKVTKTEQNTTSIYIIYANRIVSRSSRQSSWFGMCILQRRVTRILRRDNKQKKAKHNLLLVKMMKIYALV